MSEDLDDKLTFRCVGPYKFVLSWGSLGLNNLGDFRKLDLDLDELLLLRLR